MYLCIYIGARQANMLAHLESVFQEPPYHDPLSGGIEGGIEPQQQFEDADEEEEEEGPAKKK